MRRSLLILYCIVIYMTHQANAASTAWIDAATGHKIIRLDNRPNITSLYFHQNSFTPSGNGVILQDKHNIYIYDRNKDEVRTIRHWELPVDRVFGIVAARRSASLYYIANAAVWKCDLHDLHVRKIAAIPDQWASVSSLTVNADETLLAGSFTEGLAQIESSSSRREWVAKVEKLHSKSILFTVDVATGGVHVEYSEKSWIDHPQFSPTNPKVLSFTRQVLGAEDKDSLFLYDIGSKVARPVLKLTEHGETLIHGFFSPSGQQIWYDLQAPWGRRFFIGYSNVSGARNGRFALNQNEWSIHYNLSPKEDLIAGDGNPHFAGGQWIYLFHINSNNVSSERLVNLANQDYSLEPNVQFSPDGRWVLFRANIEGSPHPYLVEVAKAPKNLK